MLGLFKEGLGQAREALEIYERVGDVGSQAQCWVKLAMLLRDDEQLDAAEEAGFRAIKILPEGGQEWRICQSHRNLGTICHSKREKEKAIQHFETALTIASSFDWSDQLSLIHHDLAKLFHDEDDFDKAHTHVEQSRSYTVDDPYQLGRAILLQARVYYRQHRLEDSASVALGALEIFEGLRAQGDAENCTDLLRDIEQATKS